MGRSGDVCSDARCAPRARASPRDATVDSEARQRRREASRAAARGRRRRLVALAAGVAVAVIVILAASGGGGARRQAHRVAHAPATRHAASSSGTAAAAPIVPAPPGGGHARVPILMYHVIAAPPPGAPFPGLYVTPHEFAAQMQALSAAGWRATTLDRLAAYWSGAAGLPRGKPVVLTFDNGYQSQFTQALPVLRRFGWVADENIQITGLPPSQGGLGEQEVREMVAAGWELDTQGFSHADLITLDAEQLHHEVAEAREVLRRRYGVPVNWFCYPSGHYDATVVAAVRAAGYRGSTTVIPGWAHREDDPFRLHRLRVLGGTSPSQLLAQIESARSEPASPPSYGGA
jgi:peptidoglycan/xylan/chitin deacetylase (PgdA/CDA1 family)